MADLPPTGSLLRLTITLSLFFLIGICHVQVFAADDPVVTSVEPAVIQQGDTVLLTISGEDFPTGTVVVEFFPQQIALLDVLSADETEVVAQIKVPSLAQPGKYNILIYNQLGEELFAEGMLEISSQVITPVFRDYQPKTIGDAAEGFALLLTGESITPEVIDHLSMQWSLNSRKLDKLTTIFSYGTHGQVLCAVTGMIPGGLLQGRINLDGKPIYLVEIQNQTVQAMIVGQQPTVLSSAQQEYKIRLLGTDFTAAFIAGLVVSLETETLSSKASGLEFIDASTCQVTFKGPLPAADYALIVIQSGEELFRGNLLLTVQEAVEEQSDQVNVGNAGDQDESPSDQSTDYQVEVEQPAVSEANTPHITGFAPEYIIPGTDPASFAFTSTGLNPDQYERLDVSLSVEGTDCSLLFIGAGRDSCTCMFSPPFDGWVEGDIGYFSIVDPQSEIQSFTAEIPVSSAGNVELSATEAHVLEDIEFAEVTEQSAVNVNLPRISLKNTDDLGYGIDLLAGTVSPDSLSIELECEVSDLITSDQIGIEFDPMPANTNSAYFMQQSGSTLKLLIDLTAWSVDDLARGLTLQFTSSVAVEWVPGSSCLIPNLSGDAADSTSIFVLSDECRVDNGGFHLLVFTEDGHYSTDEITDLEVDSDDNLLKINLDKFRITAVNESSADGKPVTRLSFGRDDELLDEIAYWLMMDSLIDGPGARISLSWPGLLKTASTEVRFLRDN